MIGDARRKEGYTWKQTDAATVKLHTRFPGFAAQLEHCVLSHANAPRFLESAFYLLNHYRYVKGYRLVWCVG